MESAIFFFSLSTESTWTSTFWPTFEHLARMVDPAPGELADMHQAVGAAEVDERAEVGQVADRPGAHLADFQLVQQLLTPPRAPLLHREALGENQAVAVAVDLDDLELELAPAPSLAASAAVSALSALSSRLRLRIWLIGTKPRMPSRLTIRPPLLKSITSASSSSPRSDCSWAMRHWRSSRARLIETMAWPSGVSGCDDVDEHVVADVRAPRASHSQWRVAP